jgi:hypothetical protein
VPTAGAPRTAPPVAYLIATVKAPKRAQLVLRLLRSEATAHGQLISGRGWHNLRAHVILFVTLAHFDHWRLAA